MDQYLCVNHLSSKSLRIVLHASKSYSSCFAASQLIALWFSNGSSSLLDHRVANAFSRLRVAEMQVLQWRMYSFSAFWMCKVFENRIRMKPKLVGRLVYPSGRLSTEKP